MSETKDLNAIAKIYCNTAILLEDTGFTSKVREAIKLQKTVFRAVGTALPTRALCLGLGEISKDEDHAYTATVQLYAFNILLEAFGIPVSMASVHDPMFKESDKAFVRSFGLNIPDTPEMALEHLVCHEPTLVFNPFLPFGVLELVLKQNWRQETLKNNWRQETLKNVILLGAKLDGWLNDHFLKHRIVQDMSSAAYIPRLDRCMPLFEVEALVGQVNVDQGDLADADEDEDSDDTDKPVGRVRYALGRANAVAGLCFQWIPPYRVYATGEQFWQVLQLKDTAWKNLAVEEEEREAEERKARRKAKL